MLGISNLLCYAVGLLYPTYKSFKALLTEGIQDDVTVAPATPATLDTVLKILSQQSQPESQQLSSPDVALWLTYWVVYSFLSFAEAFLTSFYIWIPFYYEVKLVFLLWLILPQTKGARVMFEKYLCPLMAKYASQLDPIFNTADTVLQSQQVGQAVRLAAQYGPGIAQQAMQKAYEEAARLAQQGRAAGTSPSEGAGRSAPRAFSTSPERSHPSQQPMQPAGRDTAPVYSEVRLQPQRRP